MVAHLRCEILRWVDDEPLPGWVEARFTDAHGREWIFYDKPPLFAEYDEITRAATYPVQSSIACEIVHTRIDEILGEIVTVSLSHGVESAEGESTFDIRTDQVVE